MKISAYAVLFLLFFPLLSFTQQKFDFYLSNNGNDAYPGTSDLLPKKSIAAVAPLLQQHSSTGKGVKVGLKSGDVWEENLVTSYPIQLNTYSEDPAQKNFAILDGAKEFATGWLKQAGANNTFMQAIPYTGFTGYGINGIGGYSFIYVFEIDKRLEKTAPFTARKMLQFVTGTAAVENTRGSFYIPQGNPNPMPVFIHTSDDSSPNANTKYRYEVCIKDWAVNSTYQDNNHFENLWVRGFGAGNGMLPGGANSYYNKVVFGPGAGIHHLVVRSGIIDHSLFLPGAKNTNEFAVVFYDVEGLGRHCTIKNTMFLDIQSPVYAHTSLGTNYGSVEMNNVVAFADSSGGGSFMYTSNNDTVLLNKVYTDGYYSGYHYGNARYARITNSSFRDVTFGIAFNNAFNPITSTVSNVFIKTKGAAYGSGIIVQNRTSLTLANSIIHIFNSDNSSNKETVGSFVAGSGAIENKVTASGNIFICDIDPLKSLTAAGTNISNGTASSKDSWHNNVYVLLRGKNISWIANKANGSNEIIQKFEEWKRQSGQDKNSLFFDLRYDVRGLKAIFMDPENGNYDLAETPEGKQIAALHAGMTEPLTCFLQRPTYEEAADLIRNNKNLSVNTCRNPCQQNTARVNNSFDLSAINNHQVSLKWNISEQQNIDHYELQRSSGLFGFNKIKIQSVVADSLYSFIDDVQPGITYRYRLLIAAKAGGQCYSDTRVLKIIDEKPLNIYPNPSNGKIYVSLNEYTGGADIYVLNSVGQTIMVTEGLSVLRALELNLTNQAKGIYFLKMKTKNGTFIQKFVLQ